MKLLIIVLPSPRVCISADVEASEAPAFDVVLKADKKRLQLLEEVSASSDKFE